MVVLLRRCNESISFTLILLAWLAFVDLLASSLIFISQLTHVPDHDQHTFQFQGTLMLWSLSTAALGPLMLTTILTFHNLFPLNNEAVNASCYIQTSTVAVFLLGGWIFPLFSALYPESGLFFAFCVIALTAISFSVLGAVAVLGVMVSQQRTHQGIQLCMTYDSLVVFPSSRRSNISQTQFTSCRAHSDKNEKSSFRFK